VVLVPPGTAEETVVELFQAVEQELARLGAHLVGGHTEVTPAVTRPVVVGQMLGLAENGRIVPSGGSAVGDVVVQIRPAPIEGAAVLARELADGLQRVDGDALQAALIALDDPGISVVEPALLATGLGAVALHDPTEGGLGAGLHELAAAAGVRIRVDREQVLWFEPGLAVCRELGADPWSTLASGTLLAVFSPDAVETALEAFKTRREPAAIIGAAETGTGVVDAAGAAIAYPERDEVARLLAAG
jgi:hydrogenase maturation factor